MKIPYIVIIILLILGLGLHPARAAVDPQILLAEDGETSYQIVISTKEDVSTQAVAKDFAKILQQISGATFLIVTDTTPPQPNEIILGSNNSRLTLLGLNEITKDFVQGEYEIRTVDHRLVITGAPPRGSINGIYGFLQDHLGCRWFTPGVSRIPAQATIALNSIEDRQKPAFRYRAINSFMHWDGAWTARNRLNQAKTYGGNASLNALMSDPRVQTIGNYFSPHAFSYIPASLFDKHPEYYGLIDGQRYCAPSSSDRVFCLTNDGLAATMAESLKSTLRGANRPEHRFVGLGQADNHEACQCDQCTAVVKKSGSSALYMRFHNKVAEEIAKEFPDAIISVLAYGITFMPTSVEMHPNIRVTWCPIGVCYAHGFNECDANYHSNQHLLEQVADWQRNSAQLEIWYYHHQTDALMPHLNLLATKRNFLHFQRMGVQDMFVEYTTAASRRDKPVSDGDKLIPAYGDAQHNGYFTTPFGLEHLRAYITCQLLWNPNFDVLNGIQDFCETYYGLASEELTRFALLVESINSYEKSLGENFQPIEGIHQNGSVAPLLKWNVVRQMDELFDWAEEKVASDEVLLRRVQMARLSLQFEILCFASRDNPLRVKAFDGFFSLAEQLGLKEIARTAVTSNALQLSVQSFKQAMIEPEILPLRRQWADD